MQQLQALSGSDCRCEEHKTGAVLEFVPSSDTIHHWALAEARQESRQAREPEIPITASRATQPGAFKPPLSSSQGLKMEILSLISVDLRATESGSFLPGNTVSPVCPL